MKKPLQTGVQLLLVIVFLIGSHFSFSQDRPDTGKKPIPQAAFEHIKTKKQQFRYTDEDITELQLSSETVSKKSGIKHLYIKQMHNGIEIHGAINTVNMTREGKVINMSNRFHSQVSKKIKTVKPKLDAEAAVTAAARHLKLSITESLSVQEKRNEKNKEVVFTKGGISLEPITAKLIYQPLENGSLVLAWEVSIYELDAMNWWKIRVDANTGLFLEKDNLVAHCEFDNHGPEGAFLHTNHQHAAVPTLQQEELNIPYALRVQENNMLSTAGTYNVFPMPVESPSHGDRIMVSGAAADPAASPAGWHTAGPNNYTITRGNNVFAYEDPNNTGYVYYGTQEVPNYSPDGGAGLVFDFPIDFTQEPVTYRDAAITNLFYWNNIIHDVWYQYGFDEASGNFQAVNFGAEGLGGDPVMAEAQDSRNIASTRNNANFGTPEDGVAPRMQMYLWTSPPDPDMFQVTAPADIAGSYPATIAPWAAQLNATPLTGKLVLAIDGTALPNEGCFPFINSSDIAGNIAVVYRGSCPFVNKVANAEAAGAIAVIVINNAPGLLNMGGSGAFTIPALMITQDAGALIRAKLDAGTDVMVSLKDESGPEIDGDFDNGIIVHEYGHGISNRLTGGPDIINCLNNAEQMGEGWSDWFGLVMTMQPGDTPEKIRGIGTYALSEPTDGPGIRPAPYSTDFSINAYTYDATNYDALSRPHGVGFVWSTMLWDMTWDLIAQYGFDEDIYNGNGGNNMAMQLVIDGLKLQACRPGFVDGRDAILMADQANYGGANQELIWRAFAKRGLGYSADQGSNLSRYDQTEAFDLPPVYACDAPTISVTPSNDVYTGGIAENIYLGYGPQSVMLTASGDPTFVYSWSPATGLSDPNIANPIFTPTTAGSYTFTVTAVNEDECTRTASVTIEVLDVRCGPKNDKFNICHSGKPLCLDAIGVADHLAHGDLLGSCGNGSASLAADAITLKATQNPFGRNTSFEFMMEEEGTYQLEIIDRDGNQVAVVAKGISKAGEVQSVVFDRGQLLDGLYIVRLVTANDSKTVRIMVMGR